MSDLLEKFIQDGKRIALSPEEKVAGHNAFLAFIRKHPVSFKTEGRHPFWRSWLSLGPAKKYLLNLASIFTPSSTFPQSENPQRSPATLPVLLSRKSRIWGKSETESANVFFSGALALKPMPLILILALLVGGGTSFAAEQALPGNPLYPIKIAVNEEVRGWISFSPETKAGWENRRAERRLEEAEKLAAEGRLDIETRATVEENFGEHAERIADHIQKFEDKQDFKAVAELSSNFETSLRVHERILAKLAENKQNRKNGMDILREDVKLEAAIARNRRENAEARISDGSNAEAKAAAEAKLRVAERKIAEVRALIARVQTSLGAQATVKAEARLAVAQELLATGRAKFDAGVYGEAFALFQKAHKIAQEGKLLIHARKNLRIDVSLNGVGFEESEESEHEEEPQKSASKKIEREDDVKEEAETKEQMTATFLDVGNYDRVELETTQEEKIEDKGGLRLNLGL